MKHPFRTPTLEDILARRRFVSAVRLKAARKEAGERPGEWLVERGWLTPERLARAVAEQNELGYADLDGFVVPAELFEILPPVPAAKMGVIPVRLDGRTLSVAVSDPLDLHLHDELERLTRRDVRMLVASRRRIDEAMARSEATAAVLKDVSGGFRAVDGATPASAAPSVSLEDLAGSSGSVVGLVNALLLAALKRRASDVHLETGDRGTQVKYRVDGLLYPATETIDPRHHRAIVTRIKVMASLDIAETRTPQDGRFQLRLDGRETDFRVSVLPTVHGEDVVIRVLDRAALSRELGALSLDGLGFDAPTLGRFRRSIREPYGMVLITGPTGSGKTTTLYAAVSELNTGEEKIVTIEDPVEYQLPGIVQIPVNEKKQVTFARGLRAVLRHDPDKIMVGEIRDAETAQIAIQASLTGHLVFTTVHANNACDVIGRFIHMGVNLYSFVSALNCVMAQRLVRTVCPDCRRRVRGMTAATLAAAGVPEDQRHGATWMEGAGCPKCDGTGYRGRTAIAEFLGLSPKLRAMIVEQRTVDELRATACSEGMKTLRVAAVARAAAGVTTLKEINRVTFVD